MGIEIHIKVEGEPKKKPQVVASNPQRVETKRKGDLHLVTEEKPPPAAGAGEGER